jgi:hypothetical protein
MNMQINIEYRGVDYDTAKKEVAGYFRMKGEAYASDASTDLQLDCELICKIMDDLEMEGKMESIE